MKSVNDSIVKLLEAKLQKRINEKFDKTSCLEIYNDIFYTVSEIVETANTPLSNESVNLLSQMYYDSVVVNGSELDPNIFTQRAKMDNIQTKELALLAVMMKGTDYSIPFLHEIKRRA